MTKQYAPDQSIRRHKECSDKMVADLNLLVSLGGLYCLAILSVCLLVLFAFIPVIIYLNKNDVKITKFEGRLIDFA